MRLCKAERGDNALCADQRYRVETAVVRAVRGGLSLLPLHLLKLAMHTFYPVWMQLIRYKDD